MTRALNRISPAALAGCRRPPAVSLMPVSQSLYIASPEGLSGKSSVALGLVNLLTSGAGRVGVFRPVTQFEAADADPVVELLLAQPAVEQDYATAVGVTYRELHADYEGSMSRIVDRFGELAGLYDVVVVVGSDYTDVSTGNEWAANAQIAANLGSPVVLVVHGRGRSPEAIAETVDLARAELSAEHAQTVAVIANRVDVEDVPRVRELLQRTGLPSGAVPEVPLLVAPTVADLQLAADAALVRGNPELAATGVARASGRGDVPAQRAHPAARGLHGDRARGPLRRAAWADPRAPVRHLPAPVVDRADRRLHARRVGAPS